MTEKERAEEIRREIQYNFSPWVAEAGKVARLLADLEARIAVLENLRSESK